MAKPAFPEFEEAEIFDDEQGKYVKHVLPTKGMTLRDYFAGQALMGIYSVTGVNFGSKAKVAKMCYEQADFMLKARE